MKRYNIKLKDDSFIHFTYSRRAEQILRDGKLRTDPPYKRRGIGGVQAISTTYGVNVPGVQYQKLIDDAENVDDEVVAILFKTDTPTAYGDGHPEEVIWHKDVNLIDPIIISKEQAISMLNDRTGEDFLIIYEHKQLRDLL